jgi:hypothetical protein
MTVISQLLSVPPYVCASITTIIVAIVSDRKRIRGPFVIGCSFIAIIGYILLAVPSVGTAGKQFYLFIFFSIKSDRFIC